MLAHLQMQATVKMMAMTRMEETTTTVITV
jgi:hypothetical protein